MKAGVQAWEMQSTGRNMGPEWKGSRRGISGDSEEGSFGLKFLVGLKSRQKGFCLLQEICEK